ncbi:MAG TPA: NUDIX hydrolase, partial [Chthoniobacterales bacterium]|nr:NUDIX hydrolase [Chthoniobacterales bacterium]
PKQSKPNSEQAGWKLLGSATRFENNICRLREDHIELKAGKKIDYAYFERDEAVIVVPVTTEGEIVLLKQYRYPVDEWCLEVPAGGTHDSGDAALEEVARKELREEVGGTAKSLTYVTSFYSANSMTDEKCHVYLAQGVELSKNPKTESSEAIETQVVPAVKAIELARSGAMKTAPCALALLLCEPLLAKTHGQKTPDDLLET